MHLRNFVLSLSLAVITCSNAEDGQGPHTIDTAQPCEFTYSLLGDDDHLNVTCYVPQLKGPVSKYPPLHTLLNNNRPIFDCTDADENRYKLGHVDNGWRIERLDPEGRRILVGLRSWATHPLHISTATPKLEGLVNVQRCASSKTNGTSAFHLVDLERAQFGFTSFYVKFARDVNENKSYYYGVSSRYYAWKYGDKWLFSAHWKNVGGSDHARLTCASTPDGALNAEQCYRTFDDLVTTKEVRVQIASENDLENAHQVLIRSRNVVEHKLPRISFRNGLNVSFMGLGTGAMLNVTTALVHAKDLAYELIDTAAAYNNEEIIGEWLKTTSNRPLIQTKVWPTELGYHRTIRSVMESRRRLGTSVLDIVLLHWPKCYAEWNVDWMDCSTADLDEDGLLWLDSWRALERLYAEGFVLAIGVSNFDRELLLQAFDESISVPPMLVQNFFNLEHMDSDVVRLCRETRTVYQAYSVFREPVSHLDQDIIRQAMRNESWEFPDDQRGFIIQLMRKAEIAFLIRSENKQHLSEDLSRMIRPLTVSRDIFDVFGPSRRKLDDSDEENNGNNDGDDEHNRRDKGEESGKSEL